jgi:hypothetical protein
MRKGKRPQKNKQPRKSKDPVENKDTGSEEEFEPKTQEKAELVPPVRRPPTAVGTGTPPPPPRRPSGPAPVPHGRPMLWHVLQAVRRSLAAVIDLADAAADVIVRGLAGRA